MFGVLFITHGLMAEGVYNALKLIEGESEGVDFLGLQPGVTAESFVEEIRNKVNKVNRGKGVLLIVDIVGGTPFNTACLLKKTEKVEVISGLNLGMALTAAIEKNTSENLSDFAQSVEQAGINSIRRFIIA